ncbi:hypothetical protein BJF91_03190 [Allorhizobium taibaishanense]|uniref:Uncharacterized protein n=1 Tax=Allorhizobium taibaishanense TaxID=887144 RepID=A0A1Q8ZZ46_9HYPH|nr:hypothetical protein [Allorhizobium taibaishanense]OLP47439.1 hypothetical protein BJF91_03190 [Allorhizobium taibaishanense]
MASSIVEKCLFCKMRSCERACLKSVSFTYRLIKKIKLEGPVELDVSVQAGSTFGYGTVELKLTKMIG